EDRIDRGRRAGDHSEDGAGRPLAPERLGDLLEQSRVPDGNGRLVGEALERGDLPGRERARLSAADDDYAEYPLLAHEGHGEDRSLAALAAHLEGYRALVLRTRDVGDIPGAAPQRPPAHGGVAREREDVAEPDPEPNRP